MDNNVINTNDLRDLGEVLDRRGWHSPVNARQLLWDAADELDRYRRGDAMNDLERRVAALEKAREIPEATFFSPPTPGEAIPTDENLRLVREEIPPGFCRVKSNEEIAEMIDTVTEERKQAAERDELQRSLAAANAVIDRLQAEADEQRKRYEERCERLTAERDVLRCYVESMANGTLDKWAKDRGIRVTTLWWSVFQLSATECLAAADAAREE